MGIHLVGTVHLQRKGFCIKREVFIETFLKLERRHFGTDFSVTKVTSNEYLFEYK